MKVKQILLVLGLVFCTFFIGAKNSIAQDVQVRISLPVSGNYNTWTIIFTGNNGTYTFYTDDNTEYFDVIGTVPAGRYNIEFQSIYSPEGFDFGICGPNFYHFRSGVPDFDWFGAEIEEGTYIQIDEGY